MTGRNRWVALLLVIAVLASACSDDSLDEESEPYADAIAERFDPTPDRPTGQMGRCFAHEFVGYLGTDRLAAIGTPEDVAGLLISDEGALGLSAAEAEDVAGAFVDCGPDISRGIAAGVLDNYGVQEIEQPGCLAAAGRPLAVAFFSAAFVGEDSAPRAFTATDAAVIAGDLLGCGSRLADDMRSWLVPRLELGQQFLGADGVADDEQRACVDDQIDQATLERFLTGELARTNSSLDTLFATDFEVFGPIATDIAGCF